MADISDVVERVARRKRLDALRVVQPAERGVEPLATWVREGAVEELERRAVWTERNCRLFE